MGLYIPRVPFHPQAKDDKNSAVEGDAGRGRGKDVSQRQSTTSRTSSRDKPDADGHNRKDEPGSGSTARRPSETASATPDKGRRFRSPPRAKAPEPMETETEKDPFAFDVDAERESVGAFRKADEKKERTVLTTKGDPNSKHKKKTKSNVYKIITFGRRKKKRRPLTPGGPPVPVSPQHQGGIAFWSPIRANHGLQI